MSIVAGQLFTVAALSCRAPCLRAGTHRQERSISRAESQHACTSNHSSPTCADPVTPLYPPLARGGDVARPHLVAR